MYCGACDEHTAALDGRARSLGGIISSRVASDSLLKASGRHIRPSDTYLLVAYRRNPWCLVRMKVLEVLSRVVPAGPNASLLQVDGGVQAVSAKMLVCYCN